MKPITRMRAPDLAAASLREGILSGQLTGRLPGTRPLAKRLGVSAPTVAAALEQLVADGLLEKPGERQAYRVAGAPGPGGNAPSARRLLLLTHQEPGLLEETSRRILETLRQIMVSKGWRVDAQVMDFMHVKRPQRSWDRLIEVDESTWVISLYGRQALAEWAVRRKVRMFFLGGMTGGHPIPLVAVRSSALLEIALSRLVALGHWKVVIPLCDRAESFKQSIRAVSRRLIEAAGHHYVASYHNPESDYLAPDVTARIIESAFASNPPTALVFIDWKELVTAQCVLMRLGLRVPEDVSLILLNDQMEAGWFQPTLCRFRFPERRMINAMVGWLEGRGQFGRSEEIPMRAQFIEGATMVQPKAGR
jgi:hypothetical protein